MLISTFNFPCISFEIVHIPLCLIECAPGLVLSWLCPWPALSATELVSFPFLSFPPFGSVVMGLFRLYRRPSTLFRVGCPVGLLTSPTERFNFEWCILEGVSIVLDPNLLLRISPILIWPLKMDLDSFLLYY